MKRKFVPWLVLVGALTVAPGYPPAWAQDNAVTISASEFQRSVGGELQSGVEGR